MKEIQLKRTWINFINLKLIGIRPSTIVKKRRTMEQPAVFSADITIVIILLMVWWLVYRDNFLLLCAFVYLFATVVWHFDFNFVENLERIIWSQK